MPKKIDASKDQSNPVEFIYRGVEVRRYPVIILRVDQTTFRDIIDHRIDCGLTDRQILGYSSEPCGCCFNKGVVAYTRDDKKVEVKRGILSKRIPGR